VTEIVVGISVKIGEKLSREWRGLTREQIQERTEKLHRQVLAKIPDVSLRFQVAKWLTSGHTHFPVIGKIPYSSPRCPPVPTYIDVYEGVGGVQYVFGDGGKLIFGNWLPENTRHDLVLLLRHSINAHEKPLVIATSCCIS
jgi:hypothetical protein